MLRTLISKAIDRRRDRDDAGTTLILVLIFIVVAGIIIGALGTAAANDLLNSTNFKSARNLQTDATTAVDQAMQAIRYTPLITTNVNTLSASPPAACWHATVNPPPGGFTSVYTDPSDNNAIAVWCSTAWSPSSAATRTVTFSACPNTTTAAACAAAPLLQAVVVFDDYPPGGTLPPSQVACVTYCGTGMTISRWVFRPTVPSVTSIGLKASPPACPATTPAQGPVTGGTSITICGTGFNTNDTVVTFVEETGGAPTSDNVVVPVSSANVTVNSSTMITATSPTITEGSTYFVTVTTQGGTSAYSNGNGASNVFTYTATTPTVTGITPQTGETVGGTAVQISGKGFVSGESVYFVEENGGSQVSPKVSVPARYVTGPMVLDNNGDTSITAVSPSIYQGQYLTYYVEVVSPSGSVSGTTAGDVFTYSLTTPVVSGICTGGTSCTPAPATAGSPGTQLTVYGTGFYTGETVTLQEENGGNTENQSYTVGTSGVTVLSETELTVTAPTPSVGSQYFVEANTPNNQQNPPGPCDSHNNGSGFCTSSNQIVFSYPPTISSMSPSTGPADSTTVTINGNYFANDGGPPTVSFLEETGGSLVSPPVTVVSTNVNVSNYGKITASVPQVAEGVTYWVTVTTPGGTTWSSGAPYPPVFTYSAPTVTGDNPTSSGTNGNRISVTGTDFYTSNTTVCFTTAIGQCKYQGANVTINSSTSLSVNAPTGLVKNTSYDVMVQTPAGSSTQTSVTYKYT